MDLEPIARRLRAKRMQAIETSLQTRRVLAVPPPAPTETTKEMSRERIMRAVENRFQ